MGDMSDGFGWFFAVFALVEAVGLCIAVRWAVMEAQAHAALRSRCDCPCHEPAPERKGS